MWGRCSRPGSKRGCVGFVLATDDRRDPLQWPGPFGPAAPGVVPAAGVDVDCAQIAAFGNPVPVGDADPAPEGIPERGRAGVGASGSRGVGSQGAIQQVLGLIEQRVDQFGIVFDAGQPGDCFTLGIEGCLGADGGDDRHRHRCGLFFRTGFLRTAALAARRGKAAFGLEDHHPLAVGLPVEEAAVFEAESAWQLDLDEPE